MDVSPASDPTAASLAIPCASRPPTPPPAKSHPVALTRHILDDRCRTRDLFCPASLHDPKAPIRFSTYLEKQNRHRPDRTFPPAPLAPPPPRPAGPSVDQPAPRPERPDLPPPSARGPRLGDVCPPAAATTGPPRLIVQYELHRPIPSGMTIDVFA